MYTVTKKIGISLLAVALAGVVAYPQTPAPQRGRSATTHVMMRRGYLGVGVVDLTPERMKALNRRDDSGVEVKHVDENSPASRAGLRENDLILEVNRQKIEDVDQFVRAISETAPGSKVDLTVWRNSALQSMTATLEARAVAMDDFDRGVTAPAMPPMPPSAHGDGGFFIVQAPVIGFEGEGLGGQLAEFFGVKSGVLVRSVSPATPAARAGLKAGDVVTKVNGMTITSTREIQALVRMSRKNKVPFTIVREKKELTTEIEMAQ